MTVRTILIGRTWILAAALAMLTTSTPLGAQPRQLAGLDAYIEKALREWQVPGLTITVVKNDSVVIAKGYGVRELGKPERVDDRTLFAIGSCTKAFGSATVAMLVQDGKLNWEDRVQGYLPWLELWDPWVTREVRVRDLLAHRVGTYVGTENRLRGFTSGYRDWIHRSRFLQPIAPFRDRYVYSNLMLIIAGEVVKAASGAPSWNDFARERLWAPLGMPSTTANIRVAQRTANKVSPHVIIDSRLQPVPWELDADSLANPTGGVNSTARDMAQWIRFQLGEGRLGGRELLRPDVFREMHALHSPAGLLERREGSAGIVDEVGARFIGYGLGWIIQDYRGRKMVHHGGSAPGQTCWVGLLPEERLGVYIGVSTTKWLPEALVYWIFDAYLGAPRRDWSSIRLATARAGEEAVRREQTRRDQARASGTKPTLPAEAYTGTYDDGAAYGSATVRIVNGALTVQIGRLTAALQHWDHDTFVIPAYTWFRPADPPDSGRTRTFYPVGLGGRLFVTFGLDPATRVSEMKVEDIATFKREP